MKKLTAIFCLITTISFAQQDPQFTHYWRSQQFVNPGATGSDGAFNLDLLGRYQWVEFDGAPMSGGIQTSYFIDKINSGVGLQYFRDKLGFETNNVARMSYAYHIPIGIGKLGVGLSGGIIHKKLDAVWITPDGTPVSNDPSIPDPSSSDVTFDLSLIHI